MTVTPRAMRRSASKVEALSDKRELEAVLSRDRELHLYEIGDLDPFFWPQTTWWGMREADGTLSSIALLYRGGGGATLIALGDREPPRALLAAIEPALPEHAYGHLAVGVSSALAPKRQIANRGLHLKMALRDPSRLAAGRASELETLGRDQLDEVLAFYARAYPGNFFDPRMLASGCYVGLRREGQLVAVAGVHVYSPLYRVVALGNIATDPDHRGQGLAARATAELCRRLLGSVEVIGLNVRADNAPAIACYRKLGFAAIAHYEECVITPSAH
jgi:ribosomal protein S18 acetylase RimI-like enzyme